MYKSLKDKVFYVGIYPTGQKRLIRNEIFTHKIPHKSKNKIWFSLNW